MTNKITREELRALVESGEATVVEALPAAYFEQEHIPGAIQVDYEQLELQAPRRLPDKHAAIVTYCASLTCRNSEIAARKLVALGYGDVREYAEGKADWIEAGYPVESGAGVGAAAS